MAVVRVLLLLAIVGILGACTSGPSESDIKTAVSKLVTDSEGINKLTGQNTCGVAKGPVTEVTTVDVIERGEKNEKGSYWPLKIKVTGTCHAQMPNCGDDKNQLCPPEASQFDGVDLEVRITKDDFGKYVASAVPPKRSERDEAASHAGAVSPPPKLALDPSVVTEITIQVGEQPAVTLKKADSSWRVGEGDAYQSRVEALLNNLGQLKASAVIAEKPSMDALARYDLTDGKSIHVLVKAADKTVANMKIGKSGSRGVMALIDDKVVSITGFSRFAYERTPDDWKQPQKAAPTSATAAPKTLRMTCPGGATPTAVRLGCMCPGSSEIRNPCESGGNFPNVEGNACVFQCAE